MLWLVIILYCKLYRFIGLFHNVVSYQKILTLRICRCCTVTIGEAENVDKKPLYKIKLGCMTLPCCMLEPSHHSCILLVAVFYMKPKLLWWLSTSENLFNLCAIGSKTWIEKEYGIVSILSISSGVKITFIWLLKILNRVTGGEIVTVWDVLQAPGISVTEVLRYTSCVQLLWDITGELSELVGLFYEGFCQELKTTNLIKGEQWYSEPGSFPHSI